MSLSRVEANKVLENNFSNEEQRRKQVDVEKWHEGGCMTPIVVLKFEEYPHPVRVKNQEKRLPLY